MIKSLEQVTELQEQIRIVYAVTGYVATLLDHGDVKVYAEAEGKTIREAIDNLERHVQKRNLGPERLK